MEGKLGDRPPLQMGKLRFPERQRHAKVRTLRLCLQAMSPGVSKPL